MDAATTKVFKLFTSLLTDTNLAVVVVAGNGTDEDDRVVVAVDFADADEAHSRANQADPDL